MAVAGDHLAATHNPLAIPMRLRRREAIPVLGGRVLVLVHGLCMSDLQWSRKGHDHGLALANDLGFTPAYLSYNSGLHVSQNGRSFAAQMTTLIEQWPVEVQGIVLIGHSMGGLVIRSALHYAQASNQPWLSNVHDAIFLGTPHHGSPIERGGNWIDVVLDANPYTTALSRLGKVRSAGITDLRFGNLVDEDWQGRDRFRRSPDLRRAVPLPDNVRCYAIAAGGGRNIGDGLVPVDSALGRHHDPSRSLAFAPSRQWIAHGIGHLDLLNDTTTYQQIKDWLD